MAATAETERIVVRTSQRARAVWAVIALSTSLFVALCALGGIGVSRYLSTVTITQTASLELRQGSQLVVRRRLALSSELVNSRTTLNEGDEAQNGENTEAFLQLFDGSTVQTYFSTTLRIDSLRTSQFFQNLKEANIYLRSGTAVLATADLGGYSSANYQLYTDQAEIDIGSATKVRVSVEGQGPQQVTQATVTYGSATMQSHGRKLDLRPGTLASVTGDNPPEGPSVAEEELVVNGSFEDPPTSGAEEIVNGGLGTAAWQPIRDQSSDTQTEPGTASVVTETLPGLGVVKAALIDRQVGGDRYARVGIRQDINRPVDFYRTIKLAATVKVVRQSFEAGGPQGNLFPLTIRVTYSDSDRVQHEWKHSFYLGSGKTSAKDPATTLVPQGSWIPTSQLSDDQFVLKSANTGLDIAVINSIEVYGYGTQFQGWVTGLSMVGR
jgi:hypothetical protein